MELATCNDIEVDVVLLHTEEGVANSTARGRGLCDSVRWPWHSNIKCIPAHRNAPLIEKGRKYFRPQTDRVRQQHRSRHKKMCKMVPH
jgi:hypothetical protein